MAIDIKKAKMRLDGVQKELEAFSKLSAEFREPVILDQNSVGRLSRMDSMQQQAMAQAQERNRTRDLVRIEMAHRRMNEDEYGYCVNCGEEIPDKRLEIDPMAERCVTCAENV
ncbi:MULTISPECIES: TraR/DksA family transcriptional regulator [unclassified Lentilitoribacter]|jgi:DnaK suppressor protein|uniref:TraR/DksA family transcriptional regulator n=1 Tax=unclassified Lentilitoribacter TaxID=2647570 RepID=UPI0013A6F46B|nr:TraR/DksA C4-type zinc finger protein [Lentilitoribacter sp. Alg239-R112]